jgi:hypothetical protein
MFQTLDAIISLSVIFLILSMVHKYNLSFIKRLLKTKARIIGREMGSFVGQRTSKYLIGYLREKAEHLNFLDENGRKWKREGSQPGLRSLSKKQLLEVTGALETYLKQNQNTPAEIIKDLKIEMNSSDVTKELSGKWEVIEHLGRLKGRIEDMYENTTTRIADVYESKLRKITLASGLIFAVIINADFFELYQSLSRHSLAREKLVAQASIIQDQAAQVIDSIDSKGDEGFEDVKSEIEQAREDIFGFSERIKNAGLELGWTGKKWSDTWKEPAEGVKKFLGFIISGLLISFGAPFWHDLLSSLSGLNQKLKGQAKAAP